MVSAACRALAIVTDASGIFSSDDDLASHSSATRITANIDEFSRANSEWIGLAANGTSQSLMKREYTMEPTQKINLNTASA